MDQSWSFRSSSCDRRGASAAGAASSAPPLSFSTRSAFAALAISAGLAIWSQRMPQISRRASVGLLIGGALGNALDRAIHGAVFDFLNMSCCGWRNPYAFNIADVCIFVGAAGLILLDGSDKQKA